MSYLENLILLSGDEYNRCYEAKTFDIEVLDQKIVIRCGGIRYVMDRPLDPGLEDFLGSRLKCGYAVCDRGLIDMAFSGGREGRGFTYQEFRDVSISLEQLKKACLFVE